MCTFYTIYTNISLFIRELHLINLFIFYVFIDLSI